MLLFACFGKILVKMLKISFSGYNCADTDVSFSSKWNITIVLKTVIKILF